MPAPYPNRDEIYSTIQNTNARISEVLAGLDPLLRLAILGASVNLTLSLLPATDRELVMEEWFAGVREFHD